jgi:opacity protein-like surface antigen
MKKTFLLIAALLMMGSAAFAGGGFDISIGPKVGFQSSKLSYQREDIKAGFANHFTVGVFGRVEIAGFYVQPEVLWFKSSNAFNLATNVAQDTLIGNITFPSGADMTFTLNAMNIQVPILFGYKYDIIGNLIAIRAQVGPTLNFTFPQKTLVSKAIGNSEATEIDNETFDTKSIAFGLQGGIGVDVLKRITLDVNYNFGISKLFGANLINNTEWGQYVDTNNISNVHTNMFMVTVGYKFL